MTSDLRQYFEFVFPQKGLSPWERLILLSLYVSNDFKCGEKFVVKLGRVASLAGASDTSARLYLRSLAEKGVVEIDGYGRDGYRVTLLSPSSIEGVNQERSFEGDMVDIDAVDFFRDRRFVSALLERQGGVCFYSMRQLDEESCELDHLTPQGRGGDNSYRNIVCCTFEMNKRKGDMLAEDFFRSLFRSGFASEAEFEERLSLLNEVRSGNLKPAIRPEK
jgi:hypothetical protein